MKILVLNLLRIGDFLQIVPVLDGLVRSHPGARLDVLTFREAARVQPLVPHVTRWWTLDRDALQEGLGRAEVPLTTSLDVLSERLREISNEHYDLVVNLTHTEFSSYVAGLIPSANRVGVARGANGRVDFHSPWFRYLDAFAQRPGEDVMHYLDVFWQACGLGGYDKRFELKRTAAGSTEVAALELDRRPVVACQLFTSDVAKNWPADDWVEALNAIGDGVQIVLLGAPDERARVEAVRARVPGARVLVGTFDGVLALLDRARVLITGDTSVKHLAAATGARIVELALGPSEYRRQGAYPEGSFIVRPPGGQARVEPSVVTAITKAVLDGAEETVADVARAGGARVHRVRILDSGFWFAFDLADAVSPAALESLLRRCTWKFWLNGEFKRPVAAYGSEGLALGREIGRWVPPADRSPLLEHLDFLESALGTKVEVSEPRSVIDFAARRQLAIAADETSTQREIQVKLIRSLKSLLMEST